MPAALDVVAHRFQQPQRAGGDHVGRVFRLIEAHPHVRLRRQIVDFVRLHFFDYVRSPDAVGHVAIVQIQTRALLMRIGIDRIQPLGIERGGAPHDAVNLVTFRQQKLCQE